MLPFWLHPPPPRSAPCQGQYSCDVIVIGAGICGLSTAWHLRNQGLSVIVLESRGVAFSATGRNAGFILQGTAERYNRAIEQMGRPLAKSIHQYSLENHRLMKELITEENIQCEYQQRGSLQLASSDAEIKELLESARLLEEDGFSVERRTDSELGEPYCSAGFSMGIFLPEDAELHPVQFCLSIAQKLRSAGVQIFENSHVHSIDSSDGVQIQTTDAILSSEIAILCTNAKLGELLPSYRHVVSPVRGQMLCTAPVAPIFEQPIYADHGYDYWRQTPTGNIVLGGWRNLDPDSEVGHEEILHDNIQEEMHSFLRRFRGLEDIKIEARWSGIMGFSLDGLPLVGAVPGSHNILIGAGFTGHGFGFAWLAGRSLAELILEGQSDFSDLCAPSRFL